MNSPHTHRPDDRATDAPSLSSHGAARRKVMLSQLVGEMQRVHGRRRARRRTMVVIVPAILCAVAVIVSLRMSPPINVNPQVVQQQPPGSQPHSSRPAVLITYVSDDELLRELASIDRPTGLVRTDDKVWLTRDVVDPAPATPQSAPSRQG